MVKKTAREKRRRTTTRKWQKETIASKIRTRKLSAELLQWRYAPCNQCVSIKLKYFVEKESSTMIINGSFWAID